MSTHPLNQVERQRLVDLREFDAGTHGELPLSAEEQSELDSLEAREALFHL